MDGRSVWVKPGDVDGRIEAGNVVTATRALDSWCLRGDDGSTPIAAGSALEIVEERPWGAAMAEELPTLTEDREADVQVWIEAGLQLQAEGLFEVVTEVVGL